MKILIAEDEYITRLMVQVSLEKWGYRVDCVGDGNEAWEALQKPDAPQIAILDWEMPGLDGVEVCRRVKADPRTRHVPIVMMSAAHITLEAAADRAHGPDEYVVRPFLREVLVRNVERLLARPSPR